MHDKTIIKAAIDGGETYLGIELGSTRIKAVLIDRFFMPIASGSHTWENKLVDAIWTYSLDDIWSGVRACFASISADVKKDYGTTLKKVGAIGISGMMHGYMAFDDKDNLLVPFRTWRNTNTGRSSDELTRLFDFNIPQRWSIAHLYQAMLNGEQHVGEIAYLTTLAGYIHWQLTGQKVVGVGEASGIFPIDYAAGQYDTRKIGQFNKLVEERKLTWTLETILPCVLSAGESAGCLTVEGAKLLDPTGMLQSGIPVCPPEGDAGTGMVATNSVAKRTGNISAGTSVFAMIVLEKELSKVYQEIDIVTTPTGAPVAMVHCNNCSSDIDAWVSLFREFAVAFGIQVDENKLYATLFRKALEADEDGGGLLAYNYISGEPVTGLIEGRPLFVRQPDSRLTLGNFMQTHLFTSLGALKIGMDLLMEGEDVNACSITGHGGFFKVKDVGQQIMASALGTPVTVMQTAGEGGPWGMAILAAYMANKQPDETLDDYLQDKVFANAEGVTVKPDPATAASFEAFMKRYKKGLAIERAAIISI